MASNRIIVDAANKQLAKMAVVAIDRMLDSLAEMRRVKSILDSAQTGADYAALALELGLTGPNAVTQAQDFWTIFSNAKDRIDHAAVLELARLDQG